MHSIRLDRIADYKGQAVRLSGWVFNKRSSGKIIFLQVRDGFGTIQAVVSQGQVSGAVWGQAEKLAVESSITVTGTVTLHPKRRTFELQVAEVTVVQFADDYPIGKKEHGVDFLLDLRHLWLRAPRQRAIQMIRSSLIKSLYDFMEREGFTKIDAPIITPNACEGTTTLFAFDYFGDKAYLSQSGQLYLEAAIFSLGRVFDFGPVFRAEKSKTRRHLTEFWMMDAEVAFCTHDENIELQEKLVQYLVAEVLAKHTTELQLLERDTKPLERIKIPFPRITYREAIKKLCVLGSDIADGDDLGGDDETLLSKAFDKPLIVEKYPASVKAFYMKRDANDETLALCNDMLAPEGYGEIIGGSAREDDFTTLTARIEEQGLSLNDFQWYLDLRRYGSVPHAGFGLGLERMVAWICGLKHLRESIPFPRMINRLKP